jgi:hypothetical protein
MEFRRQWFRASVRGHAVAFRMGLDRLWDARRCCASQLYELILGHKPIRKPTVQAADLVFQAVGVAGFEPTASSSRSNPGGDALLWAKPNRGSVFLTCANALSGSR